ncbi:MAG: LemA family protein [candidate division Zixibacteria bacterium RBG_19FT_COMBO_42_43]|nr:MAG: LemA family protein [candidate division Zixibacteria bacterium RBG_19FT_COMBO_42_43]
MLLFFVILIAGYIWVTYNRLVKQDEAIKALWAQVETQLQRRSDLIPNLVEVVKGYAKHEKEIFENVAQARAKLAGARSVDEKISAANELSGFLGRLLAIAENYPNLKANESFNKLMDELAGTENRIAIERKRYNEGVLRFNQLLRRFPVNLIAQSFDFQKGVYFEAPESKQEVPKVEFK